MDKQNPFAEWGFEQDSVVLERGDFKCADGTVLPDAELLYRMNPKMTVQAQGRFKVPMKIGGMGLTPERVFAGKAWAQTIGHGNGHIGACEGFPYIRTKHTSGRIASPADGGVYGEWAVAPNLSHGGSVSRRKDAAVQRAFFPVLNGPAFQSPIASFIQSGDHAEDDADGLTLYADGWTLYITETKGGNDGFQMAAACDGVCATHCGDVRRSDGSDFTLGELEASGLLSQLFLFLSFLRGAHCGMPIVLGGRDFESSPMMAHIPQTNRAGTSGQSWYSAYHVPKMALRQMFAKLIRGGVTTQAAVVVAINSAQAVAEGKVAMSFAALDSYSGKKNPEFRNSKRRMINILEKIWQRSDDWGDWGQLPILQKNSIKAVGTELGRMRNSLAHGTDPWYETKKCRQECPGAIFANWQHNMTSVIHVLHFLLHLQELSILRDLGYKGKVKLRKTDGGKPFFAQVPWADDENAA